MDTTGIVVVDPPVERGLHPLMACMEAFSMAVDYLVAVEEDSVFETMERVE